MKKKKERRVQKKEYKMKKRINRGNGKVVGGKCFIKSSKLPLYHFQI